MNPSASSTISAIAVVSVEMASSVAEIVKPESHRPLAISYEALKLHDPAFAAFHESRNGLVDFKDAETCKYVQFCRDVRHE